MRCTAYAPCAPKDANLLIFGAKIMIFEAHKCIFFGCAKSAPENDNIFFLVVCMLVKTSENIFRG